MIETARDNLETVQLQKEVGITGDSDSASEDGRRTRPRSIVSNSDSSSSSSSSSDSDSDARDIPDGSSANKQGPIDKIRDYKRRDRRLHRQHRGLMQWKVRQTIRSIRTCHCGNAAASPILPIHISSSPTPDPSFRPGLDAALPGEAGPRFASPSETASSPRLGSCRLWRNEKTKGPAVKHRQHSN